MISILVLIFYPDRAILFENENSISLKGTKVKLGEEVLTSGKIKDRIGSYFLQKGDIVIEDLLKIQRVKKNIQVFISGRVVDTLEYNIYIATIKLRFKSLVETFYSISFILIHSLA